MVKKSAGRSSSKVAVFGTVRTLSFCAVLIAMSIVCGKYLAIRGGDILRFSFENLPILLAGILFGSVAGAAVGVAADLLGCVLVGYAVNPLVTLGAALIGLAGGLVWRFGKKLPHPIRVSLTVGVSHLLGSVLVKTFGLAVFYSMSVWLLMLWRLLNYTIIGTAEAFLLTWILKNKAIASLTETR